MKQPFVIILLLFLAVSSQAQQPAYFTIGQEELRNEHVYSVHQGKDKIIYITTDNGAFIYEHGKFKKLLADKEQVGSSLFGLIENESGEIYCYNLYGQIFRLSSWQLDLVFTIPEKYITGVTEMYFVDEYKLLIKIKQFLLVDTKIWEIIKVESSDLDEILNSIKKNNPKELLLNNSFSVEYWKNKLIKKGVDFAMKDIESMTDSTLDAEDGGYSFFRDKNNGIYRMSVNAENELEVEKWFSNMFISYLKIGEGGKLILATFNKGIHIVPDQMVYMNQILPEDAECRRFCVEGDTVYFITEENEVYRHDGNLEKIAIQYNSSRLDFIDFIKEKNKLILQDMKYNSVYSGLKDVYLKNNDDILYMTSSRLYCEGECTNTFRWSPYEGKDVYSTTKSFRRLSDLSCDEKNNLMYIVNNGLLESWDSLGVKKAILYQGRGIKASDLENDQDTIYASTYDDGVFKIKGDSIWSYFTEKEGLGNNRVQQIAIEKRLMFILHGEGMQVLDMQTKQWYNVGRKEGVDGKYIRNFDVERNYLWLNTGAEIIKVDIRTLKDREDEFNLLLDSISINDKRIELGKKRFSYQEKNIEFHTNFKNILLENETQLWYRLEGMEGEWENRPIHDYLIRFKSLSPGNYTFRAYAEYRNQKSEEITYSFWIVPPIWQRWWFYPVFISVVGFLIFLYFKNREKQLQKINQASLAKETAEREQIEAELKALRSQMNPHFIFNSLNSIQNLILREETDKSYDYIVLFANLVRNTLNYSNQKFIPIQKELEFLEVYLSLEKLRFSEDFNYEINYDSDTDIEVPSLLVQPFIENALLHGLLHKEGNKELNICFEKMEKVLVCTIEDNGVGRVASDAIRAKFKPHHKSFAMDAVQKRLDFLSQQYGIDAQYEIIDLYDNNKPKGTKVILSMPFIDMF